MDRVEAAPLNTLTCNTVQGLAQRGHNSVSRSQSSACSAAASAHKPVTFHQTTRTLAPCT